MKRRDIIILVVVLLLALLCCLSRYLFGKPVSQGEIPVLRITVDGKLHSEIRLDREGEILLEQENGGKNLIRYFPGGFEMAQSNCPNQDCIHQGQVTLGNAATRPLFHQIICLPNRVVLEMIGSGNTKPLEVSP